MSTHTCNITILGPPKVLVGHVVPKLSIALLIGIRVLCNARCKVLFTKSKCDVWYNGKVILSGNKDPSADLWALPIKPDAVQVQKSILKPTSASATLQRVCPPQKKSTTLPLDAHNGVPQVVSFTHSVKTRANGVKFAHQLLCNPKISTLL
jgi:hypothetical protein